MFPRFLDPKCSNHVVLTPKRTLDLPRVTTEASEASEASADMTQTNGLVKEQIPTVQEATTLSPIDPVSQPEQAWSSAIGHASTGKSGRVIEKLQAEIDRLRRENQLIKVRFDEVEKANETLAVRTQYLQDRNSNYEASHEANIRQLDRKERQVQDLREELRKEKEKTARAEERARIATTNEEIWKDQASQSQAIAQQRETEYHAIVSCRNMDNDRHQGGLDKIKANLNTLVQQREQDVEKHRRLQVVAEQQRKTIQQLEQLTTKLNDNFKAYRTEIDSAIEGLRLNAGTNDELVVKKLKEMEDVTGQMKWIVNVERVLNHKQAQARPTSRQEVLPPTSPKGQDQNLSSPSRKTGTMVDSKSKQFRKKLGMSFQSGG